MYDFLQHLTSGEIYAVTWDADHAVTAVCGPLHDDDMHPNRLPDYDYTADDAAWVDAGPVRLLSAAESGSTADLPPR